MLATEQPVMVFMACNPNPDIPVVILHRERPMVASDTGGPKLSDLLEAERWMARILLRQLEISVRELLDRFR
jgi:hypothetical protein